MSPQDRLEFNKMKRELEAIKAVLDVPFIENVKRRAVTPIIDSLNLTQVISYESDGGTTGINVQVDEAGTNSYFVAERFNGSLVVSDQNDNQYKLGYYNV